MDVNNYPFQTNQSLAYISTSAYSKEPCVCTSVCKVWKHTTDQDIFSVFSKELIQALGGNKKLREFPYRNFNEPRVLENEIIQISELNAPITIGHLSGILINKKKQSLETSEINRYTFLAIRFINREFNPNCQDKDVNIWVIKEKSESDPFYAEPSWRFLSGGKIGGWPTKFPTEDGRSEDFSKTIEYIGRLVKGEHCGIRDVCSPIEHSKTTRLGTSTVILA